MQHWAMLDYLLWFAVVVLALWLPLSAYWLVRLLFRVNQLEEGLLLRPTHKQLQAEVENLKTEIRVSIREHVSVEHRSDGAIPPSKDWVSRFCQDLVESHRKIWHTPPVKKRK